MTMFGKILVFVNLTLGLGFATLAVLLFLNRVDYSDKKKDAADERTWGLTAKYKHELDQWHGPGGKGGPRPTAEARWLNGINQLDKTENLRQAKKAWYADQVAALETGKGAGGKGADIPNPVKRVTYVDGELQMEGGLPKLTVVNDKGGQPLKPSVDLLKQQTDRNAEVAKLQQEIREQATQAEELTKQILGVFEKIRQTAESLQGSLEEQRYLERLLYNIQEEAGVLLDRQAELKARLEELKSIRTTSGNREN